VHDALSIKMNPLAIPKLSPEKPLNANLDALESSFASAPCSDFLPQGFLRMVRSEKFHREALAEDKEGEQKLGTGNTPRMV